MRNVVEPLSDEELDQLDDFLLGRLDGINPDRLPGGAAEAADMGVLCISELHGYFTALATVPEVVQPEQWLPLVWGAFSPDWQSEEHGAAMFSLFRRFKREVTQSLQTPGFVFDPCFNEKTVNGKVQLIVHDWCAGYIRGTAFLPADDGYLNDADFYNPMTVIKASCLVDGKDMLAAMAEQDPAGAARLRAAIPAASRDLFAYFAGRRAAEATTFGPAGAAPVRSARPVTLGVGRNDACPCGSGKKFKRCCLH